MHRQIWLWVWMLVITARAAESPIDPSSWLWRSQQGEDKIVFDEFFHDPRKGAVTHGVFVEVGALDGVLYSNTLAFEKNLHWSGVLIEGCPEFWPRLDANRPGTSTVKVQSAVCDADNGTVTYAKKCSASAGVIGDFGDKFTQHSRMQGGSIEVPCKRIGAMLKQHGIDHIDFFSIDVEGYELKLLETMDWDIAVDVIVIEVEHQPYDVIIAIRQLLVRHGFASQGLCCGAYANEIFQNTRYPYNRFPRRYRGYPSAQRPQVSHGVRRLKPCQPVPTPMRAIIQQRESAKLNGAGYWKYVQEVSTDCTGLTKSGNSYNTQPKFKDDPSSWSWRSQQGEDKVVFDEFFHDPRKGAVTHGVFVEVGALDGVLYSNTLAFEKNLHWSGVLIEGCPEFWPRLDANRPGTSTVKVQSAVCDADNGTVTYAKKCSASAGVIGDFGDKFTQHSRMQGGSIEVPCKRIGAMLKQHGIDHIDFFSIDVEGYELKLLETMDWDIAVDVIVIEVEHQPYDVIIAIRQLLVRHGFASQGLCCGAYANEIFQNTRYPYHRFPRRYRGYPSAQRPQVSHGVRRLKPCQPVPTPMRAIIQQRESAKLNGAGYWKYVQEVSTDCTGLTKSGNSYNTQPKFKDDPSSWSWRSQQGEDKIVFDEFFHDPRKGAVTHGVFVEVGALDGVLYSNTLAFEKNLHWSGVLIEGCPEFWPRLDANRPGTSTVKVQSAVCDADNGTVTYAKKCSASAGVIGDFGDKFTQHSRMQGGSIEVPCKRIGAMLKQHGIDHIDFFSIDVEGYELKLLETMDWDIAVDVIVIEVEHQPYDVIIAIRQLLVRHGFASQGLCCGAYANEIFQNTRYPYHRFPRRYRGYPSAQRPQLSHGVRRLKPCQPVPTPMRAIIQQRESAKLNGAGYWKYVQEVSTDCTGLTKSGNSYNTQPKFKDDPSSWSWRSQQGEDKVVFDEFFHDPRKGAVTHGVFVEVGALDGVLYSNTLAFEKNLHWSGVLIEGCPEFWPRLDANRPGTSTVKVQSAVCDADNGTVTYAKKCSASAGVIGDFGDKFTQHSRMQGGSIEVPCKRIGAMLKQHGIDHIDFFSIDVEGYELKLLETMDWDIAVDVIVIEVEHQPYDVIIAIRQLLVRHGFASQGLCCGAYANEIFQNTRYPYNRFPRRYRGYPSAQRPQVSHGVRRLKPCQPVPTPMRAIIQQRESAKLNGAGYWKYVQEVSTDCTGLTKSGNSYNTQPKFKDDPSSWSWRSQQGEDKVVFDEFFHDPRKGAVTHGVFVEVGALDGVLYSNTLAFEKNLHWSGVLIEGCPEFWPRLDANRPGTSTVKVQSAVCDADNGTVTYAKKCSASAGVIGDFGDKFTQHSRMQGGSIEVPCKRIGAMLKQHGIDHIDFFSIDVEGYELKLLETMDWDIAVDVIVIEVEHQPYDVIIAIRQLLVRHGFASQGLCCGAYANEIFQNTRYPYNRFPRRYRGYPSAQRPQVSHGVRRLKPCQPVPTPMRAIIQQRESAKLNGAGYWKYVQEVSTDCTGLTKSGNSYNTQPKFKDDPSSWLWRSQQGEDKIVFDEFFHDPRKGAVTHGVFVEVGALDGVLYSNTLAFEKNLHWSGVLIEGCPEFWPRLDANRPGTSTVKVQSAVCDADNGTVTYAKKCSASAGVIGDFGDKFTQHSRMQGGSIEVPCKRIGAMLKQHGIDHIDFFSIDVEGYELKLLETMDWDIAVDVIVIEVEHQPYDVIIAIRQLLVRHGFASQGLCCGAYANEIFQNTRYPYHRFPRRYRGYPSAQRPQVSHGVRRLKPCQPVPTPMRAIIQQRESAKLNGAGYWKYVQEVSRDCTGLTKSGNSYNTQPKFKDDPSSWSWRSQQGEDKIVFDEFFHDPRKGAVTHGVFVEVGALDGVLYSNTLAFEKNLHWSGVLIEGCPEFWPRLDANRPGTSTVKVQSAVCDADNGTVTYAKKCSASAGVIGDFGDKFTQHSRMQGGSIEVPCKRIGAMLKQHGIDHIDFFSIDVEGYELKLLETMDWDIAVDVIVIEVEHQPYDVIIAIRQLLVRHGFASQGLCCGAYANEIFQNTRYPYNRFPRRYRGYPSAQRPQVSHGVRRLKPCQPVPTPMRAIIQQRESAKLNGAGYWKYVQEVSTDCTGLTKSGNSYNTQPKFKDDPSSWLWRSQQGEDKIVFDEFFHDPRKGAVTHGVFVEVGALDGVLYSNTLAFEKNLHWSGVLIEGCPEFWPRLDANRPGTSTVKVQSAVCDADNGTVTYAKKCSASAGVIGDFGDKFTQHSRMQGGSIEVPCKRIGAMLKQHGIDHIDFFSIDVEGYELKLLETMDWDIAVDVIVIEVEHQPYDVIIAIRQLLVRHGFASQGLCCGAYANEIFQNTRYPYNRFPRRYRGYPSAQRPQVSHGVRRLKPCQPVPTPVRAIIQQRESAKLNGAGYWKYVQEVSTDCTGLTKSGNSYNTQPKFKDDPSSWSWRSQQGEDKIVFDEFFHDPRKGAVTHGVFVEVGALDGVLYSNTLAFEKNLHWSGVLIEGCPEFWPRLDANRPGTSTVKVQSAVCDADNGTVTYAKKCSASAGVIGDFGDKFTQHSRMQGGSIEVPCKRIGAMLKQHGIDHIDFFSIDVEGYELKLLETMDWDIAVDVIVIEVEHQPYDVIIAIRQLLVRHGFASQGLCCGAYANEIFQNTRYPYNRFPRRYRGYPSAQRPQVSHGVRRLKPCQPVPTPMRAIIQQRESAKLNGAGYWKYVQEVSTDCTGLTKSGNSYNTQPKFKDDPSSWLWRSQQGEDKIVFDEFFHDPRKGAVTHGVFVEVGALDGVLYSNTLAFEKNLHWSGVLIEGCPEFWPRLDANRPGTSTVKVQSAVCDADNGTVTYAKKCSASAGVIGDFGDKFTQHSRMQGGSIEVPCKRIGAMLKQHGIDHIDFFSIDVEGYELKLLETMDWDIAVDVIVIEVEHQPYDVIIAIRQLLVRHGFASQGLCCGAYANEIFQNTRYPYNRFPRRYRGYPSAQRPQVSHGVRRLKPCQPVPTPVRAIIQQRESAKLNGAGYWKYVQEVSTDCTGLTKSGNSYNTQPKFKDDPSSWSWRSQQGEDKIVFDEFFHDPRKGAVTHGVFVEVGALDGVLYSNTLAFEKNLHWSGVLIEGCPEFWPRLDANRPGTSTVKVQSAVCDADNGTVTYAKKCSASAGVIGDFGDKFTQHSRMQGGSIEVPCKRIGAMLKQHGIDHIDFFSIDVEGYELKLLETMDWDIAVDVIVIEVEHQPYDVIIAIRQLLVRHGFASQGLCCGAYANEIFQNTRYPYNRFPRRYRGYPSAQRPQVSHGVRRLKPCQPVPTPMRAIIQQRESAKLNGAGYWKYVQEVSTDCTGLTKSGNSYNTQPKFKDDPSSWLWRSQQGEDKIVFDEFFHDPRKGAVTHGVFVEVGALDGVLYSNTLAFEKNLHWSGVLIEGCPEFWPRLDANRPGTSTVKVQSAVCDADNGTVTYAKKCSASAGVIGDFGDKFTQHSRMQGGSIEVPCKRIGAMLKQHGIDHIDFFSIDVEGYELKLLETMDWDIAVDVIVIEVEHQPYDVIIAIRQLLVRHGFASQGLCCGAYANEIFQNTRYPYNRFPRRYRGYPSAQRPQVSHGVRRLKPCQPVPTPMRAIIQQRESAKLNGAGYWKYVQEVSTDCTGLTKSGNSYNTQPKFKDDPSSWSWRSQQGEDKIVFDEFFHDPRKGAVTHGVFVEVGALDGVLYSNTLAFEKNLHWSGVLIEGCPEFWPRLDANRPGTSTVKVQSAVCDADNGTVTYAKKCSASAGVIGDFGDKFTQHSRMQGGSIEVPCKRIGAMLKQHGIDHIDFFSIDVEGYELKLLETMDWDIAVDVIVIEVEHQPYDVIIAIRQLLVRHGFASQGLCCGAYANEIFQNTRYPYNRFPRRYRGYPSAQRPQVSHGVRRLKPCQPVPTPMRAIIQQRESAKLNGAGYWKYVQEVSRDCTGLTMSAQGV